MLDWKKLKLDDDDAKKALELLIKNKAFGDFVTESVTNRETAAKEAANSELEEQKGKVKEFRDKNVQLVADLEEYKGIDKAEYERLKKLGGDAGAAAEKLKSIELDYEGKINGLNTKITEKDNKIAELETSNSDNEFKFKVRQAIGQYNTDNKGKEVMAHGADEVLIEKAMGARKIVGKDMFMTKSDGTELTTDNGRGTVADWIGSEATKQFPFLFVQPTGSGATGNESGGAGDKTMSRSDFNAITDPARQAEVATTHILTD